ncbi:DNA polymerase I, thermostable [Anatilimnocola aggregata]|uniref:DNA polymerase I, thermostable n=2 Tax=Anatilimnocola aggregata TaxID=2528021 RepID=A0A517YMA0_9BACT|nr:DNA polymerase I, thermostable [Anatilimnocola aggregata]
MTSDIFRKFLLPGWEARLERSEANPQAAPATPVLLRSAAYYESNIHFVGDEVGGQAMVEFVRQRPVTHVGFVTEVQYSRPGVVVKVLDGQSQLWNDPRSVVPLLFSFALIETHQDGKVQLFRFVAGVDNSAVLPYVQAVLDLPLSFCCHFASANLQCLWQLGLREPRVLWDSWVAQRCQLLGRFHVRNQPRNQDDGTRSVYTKYGSEQEIANRCDLVSVCRQHGIEHPFAGSKEERRRSFLGHRVGRPFSQRQIDYSAADAVAVGLLYSLQVNEAMRTNALTHLQTVEMPWAVTNARMHYDGIYLCPKRLAQVHQACVANFKRLSAELQDHGLENANNQRQVERFMQKKGLLEYFRQGDEYSFDDNRLEAIEDRDPAIAKLRQCRRIRRLLNDKMFSGELIGADGRCHPDHRQLGAESTRNSMRWPNIGGIGKALRPLVVPQNTQTRGIGEVDLSQIEVGIAAALYSEPRLVEMFNSGDVYSRMAKKYYHSQLPSEAIKLPDGEFKKWYKVERSRMKVFTLATIYNITARGLSTQLGIAQHSAQQQLDEFLGLFPELARALKQAADYGQIRGYVELVTGVRRYRGREGLLTQWETNWMRNTPVQGSAAVVFKAAGNRLYRLYPQYSARLLLPLHDAFVFEAPRHQLAAVAKVTAAVMRNAVKEYFPVLKPQVDINIERPESWNKDGKHQSLDLWCTDPELATKYLNS